MWRGVTLSFFCTFHGDTNITTDCDIKCTSSAVSQQVHIADRACHQFLPGRFTLTVKPEEMSLLFKVSIWPKHGLRTLRNNMLNNVKDVF